MIMRLGAADRDQPLKGEEALPQKPIDRLDPTGLAGGICSVVWRTYARNRCRDLRSSSRKPAGATAQKQAAEGGETLAREFWTQAKKIAA